MLDDVDIARWEDDGGAIDDVRLADDPPSISPTEEASTVTHQAIDTVSVPV